jgi:hypothetical protein
MDWLEFGRAFGPIFAALVSGVLGVGGVLVGMWLSRKSQREDAEQRRKDQIEQADTALKQNMKMELWRRRHDEYREGLKRLHSISYDVLTAFRCLDQDFYRTYPWQEKVNELFYSMPYTDTKDEIEEFGNSLQIFLTVMQRDESSEEQMRESWNEFKEANQALLTRMTETVNEWPELN